VKEDLGKCVTQTTQTNYLAETGIAAVADGYSCRWAGLEQDTHPLPPNGPSIKLGSLGSRPAVSGA
jgi:hypothetical protein